jgi:hypothetical protein
VQGESAFQYRIRYFVKEDKGDRLGIVGAER